MRTLILLAAIILLVLIVRMLYRQSPQKLAQFLRQFGWVLVVGVLIFLLMTGRLPWLIGVIAAGFAIFRKYLPLLLPMLRYVPFLQNLYQRHQTQKQNAAGPSTGQTSSVESYYVRMSLAHDSGQMDGLILHGPHQGEMLSTLSLEQLLELFRQWQDQVDSISLLQAYLDRMHPDWQAQSGTAYTEQQNSSRSNGAGTMSRAEALQILGLPENAAQQDIVEAHRRLMQKLHPDRGGSTYLAAKINLAKDTLLDHAG